MLACVAATASAQTVVGTVVFPDGVTPVQSAIVQATDSRDTIVASMLTGRRGEFTFRLGAAGTYSLQLRRIGFRPTKGPTLTLALGVTDTVRIVFTGQAIALAAVNVRERETCRVNADTGLAVARVWEEARKAMLTTQLNGGGAPLYAEWITYDRTTDSSARIVRQQQVRTSRNPTTHAFKSLPAATLDDKGYIVADGDVTTYYAPDADALLSDAFVASHCFHLEPAPVGSPGLIGVSFQPTRSHRDTRDIEGTLFVDRSSAELRWLEFRYTNMPDAAEPAHAGGKVEFLRLADGRWLINRWNVRMPRLGLRDKTSEAGMRRVIMATSNVVLRALQFTGGEVTRVTSGDSLLYQATGPAIAVQVLSHDAFVSPNGAIVTLDGTDYAGTADSLGRVLLSPVLAGRYTAHVHTPLMDTLRTPPVVAEVEAREGRGTHVDSLMLPTSHDVAAGACPKNSLQNGDGMLHGRVFDAHLRPMERAQVKVTWTSEVSVTAGRLAYHDGDLAGLTDANGQWRVCGVPINTALTVRATADSGTDLRRARLVDGESLGSLDLQVRQESAEARDAAIAAERAARAKAVVELSVTDPHGVPLSEVTLNVTAPGGILRTLITGPTGLATLADLTPGRVVVRARRIGFREGDVAAAVDAGRNTIPIVLSEVSAPTLDTVRVVGDRRLAGLRRNDEFEARRIRGEATQSITREEIVKRNPMHLWQMLTGIPSIKIVDNDGMVGAISTRTQIQSLLKSGSPCPIAIMVNGDMIMPSPGQSGVDLRSLPVPDEVYGIEVFAGASNIPVQYGGVGQNKWCGMVAIWTR